MQEIRAEKEWEMIDPLIIIIAKKDAESLKYKIINGKLNEKQCACSYQ